MTRARLTWRLSPAPEVASEGTRDSIGARGSQRVAPRHWPWLAKLVVHIVSLLLLAALVTGVDAYFGTYGTWQWPGGMQYFEMLARGFEAGHLYLPVVPDPSLAGLSQPYEPAQYMSLNHLHDASLYQDHYYLYWGPVPALVHAVWNIASGGRALYDSVVQVAAAVVASLAFWEILVVARARFFPRASGLLVWGNTLAFAFGGIMLYLVGRPSVYHEALLVGVAFLVPSWLCLLLGFARDGIRIRFLILSGVLLSLAIASRVTYLGYAVGAGVLLLWWAVRAGRRALAHWGAVIGFTAPLALCGVLLAVYNYVRFGSPLEFGLRYVLSGAAPEQTLSCASSIVPTFSMLIAAIPRAFPFYPWFPEYGGNSWWFPPAPLRGDTSLWEMPVISVFLLAPIGLLLLSAPRWYWARSVLPAGAGVFGASLLLGLPVTVGMLSCAGGLNARYLVDIEPAVAVLGSMLLLAWWHAAGASGLVQRVDQPRQVFAWAERSLLNVPWRRAVAQLPASRAGGRQPRPSAGSDWLRSPLVAQVPLAVFAAVAWSVAILFGVLLGVYVWHFNAPESIARARHLADPLAEKIWAVAVPSSVQDVAEPTDATFWRTGTGYYINGATIFLKPARTDGSLVLFLDGEYVAGQPLRVVYRGDTLVQTTFTGQPQVIVSPPLTDLDPGTVSSLRLDFQDKLAPNPGDVTSLTLESARLVDPTVADLYRVHGQEPNSATIPDPVTLLSMQTWAKNLTSRISLDQRLLLGSSYTDLLAQLRALRGRVSDPGSQAAIDAAATQLNQDQTQIQDLARRVAADEAALHDSQTGQQQTPSS